MEYVPQYSSSSSVKLLGTTEGHARSHPPTYPLSMRLSKEHRILITPEWNDIQISFRFHFGPLQLPEWLQLKWNYKKMSFYRKVILRPVAFICDVELTNIIDSQTPSAALVSIEFPVLFSLLHSLIYFSRRLVLSFCLSFIGAPSNAHRNWYHYINYALGLRRLGCSISLSRYFCPFLCNIFLHRSTDVTFLTRPFKIFSAYFLIVRRNSEAASDRLSGGRIFIFQLNTFYSLPILTVLRSFSSAAWCTVKYVESHRRSISVHHLIGTKAC